MEGSELNLGGEEGGPDLTCHISGGVSAFYSSVARPRWVVIHQKADTEKGEGTPPDMRPKFAYVFFVSTFEGYVDVIEFCL